MKNLALKRIQEMSPYQPPLDGRANYDGLLLDFNERTLPPISSSIENIRTQLYPEYFDLISGIADYAGVNKDQVMITNGTDQAIDIIIRTFADRDDIVIIPEPTFSMYRQYALVNGNRIICPSYSNKNLAYPIDSVLKAINKNPKLIVICNPNNPTGTLVSNKDIKKIAQKAKNAIIYIDEAYYEFSGETAAGLIDSNPNIIISRTFSKAFGLAGLRIGYILAHQDYINELLKVRGPYDVNQTASQAASTSLKDLSDMNTYVREVMNNAKPLVEKFFKSNNIKFYPSGGNFILFEPDNADKVTAILRENGILVRPQNKPGIENSLRLTIGTTDQMRQFINIYKENILSAKQKYVFLDRDGTLIYEPQDNYQVDSLVKFRLLDGVVSGLSDLRSKGYKFILVSNQDGLGTPAFTKKGFEEPQEAMINQLRKANITFEKVFICPHLPSDNCTCRKPKTGLLDEWLQNVTVDTKHSFVCGDRDSDKDLAANLGLWFIPMTTNGNFYQAIAKEITI